jgi:hypothetical protein
LSNLICWICQINRPFEYLGTKLLNEDGEKPCYECYLEDEESSEEADSE